MTVCGRPRGRAPQRFRPLSGAPSTPSCSLSRCSVRQDPNMGFGAYSALDGIGSGQDGSDWPLGRHKGNQPPDRSPLEPRPSQGHDSNHLYIRFHTVPSKGEGGGRLRMEFTSCVTFHSSKMFQILHAHSQRDAFCLPLCYCHCLPFLCGIAVAGKAGRDPKQHWNATGTLGKVRCGLVGLGSCRVRSFCVHGIPSEGWRGCEISLTNQGMCK
mmetsp:Transcript_70517/g.124285  ORF Transcript_70517/g.124285 Transcript_70517/m.124285 type:complete len:213 (+) Transcript_70517:1884-2522(+)